MTETQERPPQLAIACYALTASAVFVSLGAWARAANIQSREVQERIRESVDDGVLGDAGLSFTQAEALRFWVEVAVMMSAAVVGISAIWMLRGDRQARLAATVAAVPLTLSSLVAGSIFGMLMAGFVAAMWMEPGRSWFKGLPIPARYLPATSRPELTAMPDGTMPVRRQPPAMITRPTVLAGSFSMLALVGALSYLLTLSVSRERVVDQLREVLRVGQDLPDGSLVQVVAGICVFIALWSLGAAVLSMMTWRGVERARALLVASSFATAGFCVALALIGVASGLLPLLAAALVARGLSSDDAKAFCRPLPPPSE